MNSVRKTWAALIVLACISSLVMVQYPTVVAQNRTIIVPDDYPTINSAIENAVDGDTILLKRGTYQGPSNKTLVINKTITLQGEDCENTIINFNPPLVPMTLFTYNYMGYANPIEIQADDVAISDLTLNTLGGAISVEGQAINLENNIINCTSISVNGTYVKISGNNLIGITMYGSYHELSNNTLSGIIQCRASYSTIAANNITGRAVDGYIIIEGNSNIVYGNRCKNATKFGRSSGKKILPQQQENNICNSYSTMGTKNRFSTETLTGLCQEICTITLLSPNVSIAIYENGVLGLPVYPLSVSLHNAINWSNDSKPLHS